MRLRTLISASLGALSLQMGCGSGGGGGRDEAGPALRIASGAPEVVSYAASDLEAAYLAILVTMWVMTASAVPQLWRDIRSSDEIRYVSRLQHGIMVAIAYAIVCGFFHTTITAVYHVILWHIEG